MRIRWIVARLRVMSIPEILHRVGEMYGLLVLQWLQLRRRIRGGAGVEAVELRFCQANQSCLFKLDPGPSGDHEHGRDGRSAWCLGHAWEWSDEREVWRRAPDTGRLWPATVFWRLDYRTGNACGDIRVAWEPSRLQHLIPLAARVRDGIDRPESSARLEAVLLSWWRENPPYIGIHYVSAMECALRLIAVLHAVDLARGALRSRPAVWHAVADLAFHHWHLIRRRLSLYSSAGNHTVAETVGLIYVGALFPEFPGSRVVAEEALSLLTKEMERQVLADGGSLEQAPGYLQFIADLGRLAIDLMNHVGWSVPASLAESVRRAESHLGLMGAWYQAATRPGDYDEGSAIGFPLRPVDGAAQSHLDAQPLFTHPTTGMSVLNIRLRGHLGCLVDHGPLGMAPNYGHGHADALSVVARWRGKPVLIDSGTYTYNGEPEMRMHFRGTAAHNTVTIDGLDQAEQRGAFLWAPFVGGALVRAVEHPGGEVSLLARHGGYLRAGVMHWRGVATLPDRGLLIWDCLRGEGRHRVTLNWHLAGVWETASGGAVTNVDGSALRIRVHNATAELRPGEAGTSIASWSPRYGELEPAACIQTTREGGLPMEFFTELSPPGQSIPDSDRALVREQFQSWMVEQ